MIRSDAEYDNAMTRLQADIEVINEQRRRLRELDLTADEVERALQPAISFHAQLQEEVAAYEAMRRGDLTPIHSLGEIGRILIGLRIAQGLSQRDLAERLGVNESSVSRDERNDYHGITVERANRIVAALNGRVRLEAEVIDDHANMAYA